MANEYSMICGKVIQIDRSGVRHWRNIGRADIPRNIVEEIECEILDGKHETCPRFVASNGLCYRW